MNAGVLSSRPLSRTLRTSRNTMSPTYSILDGAGTRKVAQPVNNIHTRRISAPSRPACTSAEIQLLSSSCWSQY